MYEASAIRDFRVKNDSNLLNDQEILARHQIDGKVSYPAISFSKDSRHGLPLFAASLSPARPCSENLNVIPRIDQMMNITLPMEFS